MIKPTQKITFINNKWGVGKTTLCFNIASKIADAWYKVLLVDADPQCNLTQLALWINQYEELWLLSNGSIYHVIKPLLETQGDVNMKIQPVQLHRDNLFLLPGHMLFSDYDDLLISWFADTNNPTLMQRWLNYISWFNRYLNHISIEWWYDVVMIDVSPSLTWSLNKTVLLSSDFFVTVANPDLFSNQWIINLWKKISKWKEEFKNIKIVARREGNSINFGTILDADPTFIWYIVNSHNVYSQQPIRNHREIMDDISTSIEEYLSHRHWINGLVSKSIEPLWLTQDYGKLWILSQLGNKTMYDIKEAEAGAEWTLKVLEKCQEEMHAVSQVLIERLQKWWK